MSRLFLAFLFFSLSVNASEHSPKNIIMVTAATGAFGNAVCSALASEGYDLIIAGRNRQKLADLENKLKTQYKEITIQSILIDFSDIKTIEDAAKQISQPIHGIVLIGPRPVLSKDVIPSKEEWSQVFSETFIAPLEVLRLFGPQIQDNGSVVVILGNSSKSYLPSYPNTNVIRLAWSGEIKNLTHFFGGRKIRVNAISPGPILTQFHRDKINAKALSNNIAFEEQLAKDTSTIPLKSYGKTQDVANLIAFLMSAKSAHLNGNNVLLDGGESSAY